MDLQDLDRVRSTTRNFTELQGLRTQVPGGLVLVGLGIFEMLCKRLEISGSAWPWVPVLFLLAMPLLVWGWTFVLLRATAYYRIAFILAGLLDHVQLMREMRPPEPGPLTAEPGSPRGAGR